MSRGSRGFDEILIEAPDDVGMKLKQVHVEVTGQGRVTYTAESEGFEVVMEDGFAVGAAADPDQDDAGIRAGELQFETTIFGFNTFFIGSVGALGVREFVAAGG